MIARLRATCLIESLGSSPPWFLLHRWEYPSAEYAGKDERREPSEERAARAEHGAVPVDLVSRRTVDTGPGRIFMSFFNCFA